LNCWAPPRSSSRTAGSWKISLALASGFGPVGVVEHANPRAERCQQLDLNVVGPPAAAQPKPVTAVQVSGLRVELPKPGPALLTLEPAPAGQRLVGGHQQLEVRASIDRMVGVGALTRLLL
jgi:hypothetical protein